MGFEGAQMMGHGRHPMVEHLGGPIETSLVPNGQENPELLQIHHDIDTMTL